MKHPFLHVISNCIVSDGPMGLNMTTVCQQHCKLDEVYGGSIHPWGAADQLLAPWLPALHIASPIRCFSPRLVPSKNETFLAFPFRL